MQTNKSWNWKLTGDVDCCGCVGLPGDVLEVDGTFAGIDLTKPLCAVWLGEIGELEFIGPFETCTKKKK